jgi:hypothetical protein
MKWRSCTTPPGWPRPSPRPPRAVATPVYRNGKQVGKATSTTWSPVLKRMIALATVEQPHCAEGTDVQFEMTVEAVRHRVPAKVHEDPLLQPASQKPLHRQPETADGLVDLPPKGGSYGTLYESCVASAFRRKN